MNSWDGPNDRYKAGPLQLHFVEDSIPNYSFLVIGKTYPHNTASGFSYRQRRPAYNAQDGSVFSLAFCIGASLIVQSTSAGAHIVPRAGTYHGPFPTTPYHHITMCCR